MTIKVTSNNQKIIQIKQNILIPHNNSHPIQSWTEITGNHHNSSKKYSNPLTTKRNISRQYDYLARVHPKSNIFEELQMLIMTIGKNKSLLIHSEESHLFYTLKKNYKSPIQKRRHLFDTIPFKWQELYRELNSDKKSLILHNNHYKWQAFFRDGLHVYPDNALKLQGVLTLR